MMLSFHDYQSCLRELKENGLEYDNSTPVNTSMALRFLDLGFYFSNKGRLLEMRAWKGRVYFKMPRRPSVGVIYNGDAVYVTVFRDTDCKVLFSASIPNR